MVKERAHHQNNHQKIRMRPAVRVNHSSKMKKATSAVNLRQLEWPIHDAVASEKRHADGRKNHRRKTRVRDGLLEQRT